MSFPSTCICFYQWWSIGLDMFGCNSVLCIFVVMIFIMFKSTRENMLIIARLYLLPVTRSNVQKVYSKLHCMKSVIILSYFINYYNKIVIIKMIWRERNSDMLVEKYHKLGIVFILYTEQWNIEISHETILPYTL
jgi:hypothetical protein